jgi:hypothetical protein
MQQHPEWAMSSCPLILYPLEPLNYVTFVFDFRY